MPINSGFTPFSQWALDTSRLAGTPTVVLASFLPLMPLLVARAVLLALFAILWLLCFSPGENPIAAPPASGAQLSPW
jgi:hypothetical protein